MSKHAESSLHLHWLGDAAPVQFAAQELARYLGQMTGARVQTSAAVVYDPAAGGVWLGEGAAFGPVVARRVRTAHPFDDRISLEAGAGRALIAGANPCSVVLAAYRWLEELGCRWFRPGPGGERVPRLADPLATTVAVNEAPAARHRVICIEGACSEDHVTSMIDYAAKRGFNAYFVQFRDAFTFFDRWYTQEATDRDGQGFTPAQARRICDRVKAEAVRRGMALHAVGHGWTCEPFGIVGNEWAPTKQRIPAAAKACFAEVKRKRELWGGIPLNTNLCYSQPKVRQLMAEAVADYAAAHPEAAIVHVWLADGSNNQCECGGCRRRLPSDWYVMILNEIDERLRARRLATRIVFLAYVDLLWAPVAERLLHPERFILMFAPITRSYSRAFLDAGGDAAEKLRGYERNRLEFPRSPQNNLRLLAGWKRAFPGDCVDFDYHLWGDWRNDPGQMQLAQVLHRDVCGLRKLGMQGFISCQNQRPFFPTGLWMEVMARGLWDPTESFEHIVTRYFADLFGADARRVRQYLESISRLFDAAFLRGEKTGAAAARAAAKRLARVPAAVAALRPSVQSGRRSRDAATAAAWRLLDAHGWYVTALARVHLAWIAKDAKCLARESHKLEGGLRRRLPLLHPVLDTWTVRQGLPRL